MRINIKQFLKSAVASLVLAVAGTGGVAFAAPQEDHKVTICHGTNSVTNPYVQEPVDVDSADGNTGNDNGQGDHSEHTGPVATSESVAQTLKDAKQAWGDIIPAHDNYGGLNWTTEGQAIYNNGCNYVTPGSGGEEPGTPGTPGNPGSVLGAATAQVTTVPQGAVNAGAGSAVELSPVAVTGLAGSVLAVVAGVALSLKRRLQ